jgi:ArsR family transcriptional regulator
MTRAEGSPVRCLDEIPREPHDLTIAEAAVIAKALGHPTRFEILELLRTRCPRTVGDIVAELPLAPSTVSNHLRILKEAGVIRTFRSEPRTWHCLNRSMIAGLAVVITDLTGRPNGT